MCQLSYVDFRKDVFLSPMIVKWLITSNCIEGPRDGFGFFLESSKKLYKTKESATGWFLNNYIEFFGRLRNTNGLYHVRRASTLVKDIKDEHAHPFKLGNLIVAHNGTLEFQATPVDPFITSKLFSEDMIDSQKFAIVLDYYYHKNKNILNDDVIKSAISEFTGSYAFLIRDISTSNLFVVKDNTKDLHIAEFSMDGEPVGLIINTRYYMLDLMSEIILDTTAKLACNISTVAAESINNYQLGDYSSFKKTNEIKVPLRRYKPFTQVVRDAVTDPVKLGAHTKSVMDTFFDDAMDCFLTLEDLFILYELKFGKSVLHMADADFTVFREVINKIKQIDYTAKRAESINIIMLFFEEIYSINTPVFDMLDVFDGTFSYPLLSNGKERLDSATKTVDVGDIK